MFQVSFDDGTGTAMKRSGFKTYYSATCADAHGHGSHGRGASLLEATAGILRASRQLFLVCCVKDSMIQ